MTVRIHQALSEATAKTVFSLYGDDRNTGTRQTPKFCSEIADIYYCCILAEVQLAHERRQIMGQAHGGGRVLHTRTGGLYTLYHHIRYLRTTPHKSTQLLDNSHCDELQARLPTIERPFQIPFQIYLTHRTTLSKCRPSNDKPKCRSKPPKNHPFSPITLEAPTRNPPSERQPLSTFSPHSRSSSSTSIAPPSPAPRRPRRGPGLVPRP